jgi:hypothetical protein
MSAMGKSLVAAMTHVRHEGFFLEKWIAHYGAIVGRENLFVVIDGEDWEPPVDLTGIQTEVLTDAPRERADNDSFMARKMSSRANDLLRERYRYVMRMDVDEYVVVDPATGLDWQAALAEVDEAGYLFATGVDMIQSGDESSPIDRTAPILSQRRHGYVTPPYSKPFVISRHANWANGGHRLLNLPVKMTGNFILFHLALADTQVAEDRIVARGGRDQHRSMRKHQFGRLRMIGEIDPATALPFDAARDIALAEFPVDKQGRPAARPKPPRHPAATERGFPVMVPDRFAGLL